MSRYTTGYINFVSFIISIVVFVFISNFNFIFDFKSFNFKASFGSNISNKIIQTNDINMNDSSDNIVNNSVAIIESKNTEESKEITKEKDASDINWFIEIPVISLKAEISEGTTKEVMDKFVGHFEDTSKDFGNIGLAAHNRGYENNYFAGLKHLNEGNEIVYKNNDFYKTYIVVKHIIISDTDWSYLEDTTDNRITLITCVENEPTYRRCIQAIEKN